MLRRNKSLSIIMALCLCLALLAPVFVAPPAAQAGAAVTCSNPKFVSADPGRTLGTVKFVIQDWENSGVSLPTELNLSIPSNLTENGVVRPIFGQNITLNLGSGDNAFTDGDVEFTSAVNKPSYNGTLGVRINGFNGDPSEDGVFYLQFKNIDCSNFAGDVELTGTGEFIGAINVKIGTVQASNKTTAVAKRVVPIGSTGGRLDNITVLDLRPGSIVGGGELTITMESKGFGFKKIEKDIPDDLGTCISGSQRLKTNLPIWTDISIEDGGDEIIFPLPADADNGMESGLVTLFNIGITVDEKVARVGQDIEVTVKGSGITEQTLVVGKYVDYLVNITEDKTTELIAGKADQYIGTFFIEEVAPGTLVKDRSILFELPAGVEWEYYDPSDINKSVTASFINGKKEMAGRGQITFKDTCLVDARTLKFVVDTPSTNSPDGAKILFKKLKVKVSPQFSGDVVLKVSGKAGAEGEVKVATVMPMIKMEGGTPAVKLGLKEQKVADVIITETKADALVDEFEGQPTALKFYLDEGFRFAKVPKVEVVEGDIVLELGDVRITTPRSGQNLLIIPIRAGSLSTPAKIKISDIYITSDRTAPTGKVAIYAAEAASDMQGIRVDWQKGDAWISGYANAFNDTMRFDYDRAADCNLADNVTEPPVENASVGSGTFVIGSNLYTVNGVTRVMDVAPYIKNDRTYVPYRYLAYVLGVAEDDVVWDQAAQTVTLTKGDNTVVATIGSTTLTVNGEAVVMDVAPEITNDRTMLPARWLAEALGATVGWDQGSQTVVVEL